MSVDNQEKTAEKGFDLKMLNTDGNSADLIELIMMCESLTFLVASDDIGQVAKPDERASIYHNQLESHLKTIKTSIYDRINEDVVPRDCVDVAYNKNKLLIEQLFDDIQARGFSDNFDVNAYLLEVSGRLFDTSSIVTYKELSNYCNCTVTRGDNTWVVSGLVRGDSGKPEIVYISTNGVYTPIDMASSVLNIVYLQALWSIAQAVFTDSLEVFKGDIGLDEHANTLATPANKPLLAALAYATLVTTPKPVQGSSNSTNHLIRTPAKLHEMRYAFVEAASKAVSGEYSEQALTAVRQIASSASKKLIKDIEDKPFLYDDTGYSLWMGFHRMVCKEVFSTSISLDESGSSLLFVLNFDADEWAFTFIEEEGGVLDVKEAFQNAFALHPHPDMLVINAINIWCTACLTEVLVKQP